MIICGLKLTHDGAVALIDNGKLIFSYEMEKLNNYPRFSSLQKYFTFDFLAGLLAENGYKVEDIDKYVIDGWWGSSTTEMLEHDYPVYSTWFPNKKGATYKIELAKYGFNVKTEDITQGESFTYPEQDFAYNSYLHVSGHIMGAYCSSPYARKEEDSFVMVWDGGMFPQMFYYRAKERKAENLGAIFHMLGNTYSVFATNYPPYNTYDKDDMSVAGKVMAYIALGTCNTEILEEYKELFASHEQDIANNNYNSQELIDLSTNLLKEFVIKGELSGASGADLMATLHVFFQEVLVEKLTAIAEKYPDYTRNLSLVGGCGLNIKWNSAIRNTGVFTDVWVPPFPNDSGSALGVACCEMVAAGGPLHLDWHAYLGPHLQESSEMLPGWDSAPCSIEELAHILHTYDEPVVYLNGRAELGPRALGNRSILAAPVSPEMKKTLNRAKKREDYRPVAPICMEEYAAEIFSPGSPDPYMLFDHKVKADWMDKIPAVCHLDGTARLQTVTEAGNKEVYTLLNAYRQLSGVPLLCNTSANYNGSGFFPDVRSAMEWDKVPNIYSNGKIYFKKPSVLEQHFADSEMAAEV